jgi:hypothetical protein
MIFDSLCLKETGGKSSVGRPEGSLSTLCRPFSEISLELLYVKKNKIEMQEGELIFLLVGQLRS